MENIKKAIKLAIKNSIIIFKNITVRKKLDSTNIYTLK